MSHNCEIKNINLNLLITRQENNPTISPILNLSQTVLSKSITKLVFEELHNKMGNLGYERVRIVHKLFLLAKLQKR